MRSKRSARSGPPWPPKPDWQRIPQPSGGGARSNSDSDLAGYLVLRGDAPGDTLRAITPEPVAATTYRDTTARAGMRYVYVVVAVDRASPQNVSAQSNRVEETAR